MEESWETFITELMDDEAWVNLIAGGLYAMAGAWGGSLLLFIVGMSYAMIWADKMAYPPGIAGVPALAQLDNAWVALLIVSCEANF